MTRFLTFRRVGFLRRFLLLLFLALWCRAASAVDVDQSFAPVGGADFFVEQALPVSGNRILICGAFTYFNSQLAPYLVRLNDDGSIDPTFQTRVVGGWTRHMAVQSDGRIIVAGAFSFAGAASRQLIARLNQDGTLDPSFDPGSGFEEKLVPPDPNPPYVFWFGLQPDGKIVVTGSFAKFNGRYVGGIARLNPDGTLDETFRSGFGLNSFGRFVRVLPSGQILVTGWFTDYNGFTCNRMVLLNSDGTPDPTFQPFFGDKTAIYSADQLPDGKFIVSGHTKNEFGLFDRKIARLNRDGSEDPAFIARTGEKTESVLVQPDGKILACGWFREADNKPRSFVARFNADGSLDENFNLTVDNWIWNMALDSQGRLLLSGLFTNVNGFERRSVARISLADARVNNAEFAGLDTETHGTWKTTYGTDGYSIASDATLQPSYGSISINGQANWTWRWTSQSPAAVQRSASSDRVAGCWYSSSSYSFDLRLAPGESHRLSVYCLDWDAQGRKQTIAISDGDSGAPLSMQEVSGFSSGTYAVWKVSGHVRVTVTAEVGSCVASAIFLDPATDHFGGLPSPVAFPAGGQFAEPQSIVLSAPTRGSEIRYTLDGSEPSSTSAPYINPIQLSQTTMLKAKAFKSGSRPSETLSASYTFIAPVQETAVRFRGTDDVTGGWWPGKFGSEGVWIAEKPAVLPAYADLSLSGKADWVWRDPSVETRALFSTGDLGPRVASCWYGETIVLNLHLAENQTHGFALYFCDWDFAGRVQQVEILDPDTNAVLWNDTISGFSGGKYLLWDVAQSVRINITRIRGPNAVVGGIFFQAVQPY